MVWVGRFGVAFLATAAVALGSTQPAFAEEAPAPPAAETTGSETTPAPTPPPADTTTPEPADPQPAPEEEPSPEPAPTAPAGGGTSADAPPAGDTAEPENAPAEAPAETEPEPKDAVKLEDALPPAPPAAATGTVTTPAPAPVSSAPPAVTIVLIQEAPVAEPAPATTAAEPTAATAAATNAEAAGGDAPIVSFRPRPAAEPIALLPAHEPSVVEESRPPRAGGVAGKQFVQRQSCARPAARIPLSQRCKQARAVAVLRVTLINSSTPEAVRAAIARVVAPVVVRRVVEARPPPDSKPKKKHPVAEVRPTVPFGDSGQGATHDGFNGSSGSTWSSRMFALPAAPLRVPRPFRFARLRMPSTVPHGVIPAPPSARPG